MHTPLTRPISVALEKTAYDIKLERQSDDWASEVISQAYKSMPFLKSYEMDAEFDRIDGSRGYGVGKLFVYPMGMEKDAAIKEKNIVVFPLIIRQENLSPFDVFSHDGQLRPMTKEAVERALFRPGIFGGVAGRKDLTGTNFGNHITPPTTGTNRYTGGGFYKSAGVLQGILPTARQADLDRFRDSVSSDPGLSWAYSENETLNASAMSILGTKEKTAADLRELRREVQTRDVIQFVESGNGYLVKSAQSHCFRPTEAWRSALWVQDVVGKEKMAQLRDRGSLVITKNPTVKGVYRGGLDKVAQDPQTVGVYNAYVGTKPVAGVVVPYMTSFDGRALTGMSVFSSTNGHALQKIAGVHVKDITLAPCSPRGRGVFVQQRGVEGLATEPVQIDHHVKVAGDLTYIGTRTLSGTPIKITPSKDMVGIAKVAEDHYVIPDSMVFLPLHGRRVSVATDPSEVDGVHKTKVASASDSLRVRGDGSSFSIEGIPAADLNSSYCSKVEAGFFLGALGVPGQEIDSILKQASVSEGGVVLRHARPVVPEERAQAHMFKRASEALHRLPAIQRQDLIKEAAVLVNSDWIPEGPFAPLVKSASVVLDRETADSVLSMQFITPENVAAYVDFLPGLEKSANRLAEIVVASRMGMDDIREAAACRAMSSLSDVIEGLNSLRLKTQ